MCPRHPVDRQDLVAPAHTGLSRPGPSSHSLDNELSGVSSRCHPHEPHIRSIHFLVASHGNRCSPFFIYVIVHDAVAAEGQMHEAIINGHAPVVRRAKERHRRLPPHELGNG